MCAMTHLTIATLMGLKVRLSSQIGAHGLARLVLTLSRWMMPFQYQDNSSHCRVT